MIKSTAELVRTKRIKLLVCPLCAENVRLTETGSYLCSAGHETKSLRELAVKGEKR